MKRRGIFPLPHSKKKKSVTVNKIWREFVKSKEQDGFFADCMSGSTQYLKKLAQLKEAFKVRSKMLQQQEKEPKSTQKKPETNFDSKKTNEINRKEEIKPKKKPIEAIKEPVSMDVEESVYEEESSEDESSEEENGEFQCLLLALEDLDFSEEFVDKIPDLIKDGNSERVIYFLLEELVKWIETPFEFLPTNINVAQMYDIIKNITGAPDFIFEEPRRLAEFLTAEIQTAKMMQTEEKPEPILIISERLQKCCNILKIDSSEIYDAPEAIRALKLKIIQILNEMPREFGEYKSFLRYHLPHVTSSQIKLMKEINDFYKECYSQRKELLKTRFQATVDTLKESPRARNFRDIMPYISTEADICYWTAVCADFLTLKDDEKTSSQKYEQSQVRQFLIPDVPDRGGRPNEIRRSQMIPVPFGPPLRERRDFFD